MVVSGVDEHSIEAASLGELVVALAEAKASAVACRAEVHGAIVVGCDSLLDVDGSAHGKPASTAEARTRLIMLRGRNAVLRTGHCVIDTRSGRRARGAAAAEVRFGAFDDDELEAYLATGEPLEVAGAFTLDGRSAPFIEGIDGDHGTVIGLSLPMLRTLLGELGIRIDELWA